METKKEQHKRASKIIKFIEFTDCEKIIIVSHGDILKSIIEKMFNISVIPVGHFTDDKIGWISYIKYKKEKYHLVSPPNNEHFDLYK